MPVVVSGHEDPGSFLVLETEEQTSIELDNTGEIQGSQNSVDVHVINAGTDVVYAFAHLVERNGLHAIFLARPANDSVEASACGSPSFEQPEVGPILSMLKFRRNMLVLGAEVAIPHVGGLNNMVVHAGNNHIIDLHFQNSQSETSTRLIAMQ